MNLDRIRSTALVRLSIVFVLSACFINNSMTEIDQIESVCHDRSPLTTPTPSRVIEEGVYESETNGIKPTPTPVHIATGGPTPTPTFNPNDIDGDGIPNGQDPDVDGDGIPNGQDPDVDGDGIINALDDDIDGDGLLNGEDPDMDGDQILNNDDPDMDGDGLLNGEDPDADADGLVDSIDGNSQAPGADEDDDGDGTPDDEDTTPKGYGTDIGALFMRYQENSNAGYQYADANSGDNDVLHLRQNISSDVTKAVLEYQNPQGLELDTNGTFGNWANFQNNNINLTLSPTHDFENSMLTISSSVVDTTIGAADLQIISTESTPSSLAMLNVVCYPPKHVDINIYRMNLLRSYDGGECVYWEYPYNSTEVLTRFNYALNKTWLPYANIKVNILSNIEVDVGYFPPDGVYVWDDPETDPFHASATIDTTETDLAKGHINNLNPPTADVWFILAPGKLDNLYYSDVKGLYQYGGYCYINRSAIGDCCPSSEHGNTCVPKTVVAHELGHYLLDYFFEHDNAANKAGEYRLMYSADEQGHECMTEINLQYCNTASSYAHVGQ